jgi:glycosyltransferase involved in cell wall biosynthesis
MGPVRIAWFSPFPPVKTGVAAVSADVVAALRARDHLIDAYPETRAHDFPWRHRQHPYDLAVYQFGNSSHHDYIWPYALRYPGLVVLHDTRLHHARAALLLRERRPDDYRAEMRANHPDVNPDVAELAIAGFDSRLFYVWGMNRTLVESSRLTAVHGEGARQELLDSLSIPGIPTPDVQSTPNAECPRLSGHEGHSQYASKIAAIRLGHGELVSADRERTARERIRARYGFAPDAIVFGVFGGLTPEKRVPQILDAFRSTVPYAPGARLLLAGAPPAHVDLGAETYADIADRVVVTGYVDETELTDYIASVDVSLNLRWPTARETSGPWLRALAAGKATVITGLVHLTGFASLDPRTWGVNGLWELGVGLWEGLKPNAQRPTPICVAVDILDEDHSLRLAMRRLAQDADLRAQLGRAACEYWQRDHTIDAMTDDYERVMREARGASGGVRGASSGVRGASSEVRESRILDPLASLRALLEPFGIESPL